MVSDKSIQNEQDIQALLPGPWTSFSAVQTGWGSGPLGFHFARFCPYDNSVEVLMDMSRTGTNPAHAVDGYQVATMPQFDSDGNPLRPLATTTVTCLTDAFQSTTPGSPRMRVNPGGAITIFGVASASTWLRAMCQKYTLDDMSGSAGGGGGSAPPDPTPTPIDTSWKTMTLQNGWTNNSPVAQYRLHPTMPSCLELVGDIAPGTLANGTQIASTLPSAYFPNTAQTIPLAVVGSAVSPTRSPIFTITGAGLISVFGVSTLTGLSNARFHEFIDLVI